MLCCAQGTGIDREAAFPYVLPYTENQTVSAVWGGCDTA